MCAEKDSNSVRQSVGVTLPNKRRNYFIPLEIRPRRCYDLLHKTGLYKIPLRIRQEFGILRDVIPLQQQYVGDPIKAERSALSSDKSVLITRRFNN